MLFGTLTLSDIRKPALRFGPISYNLDNLPDIGALTFFLAGIEKSLLQTIAGTCFGAGYSLSKNRTFIEIFELTGRNGKRRQTGQMVEKKISKLKVAEICLIPYQIDIAVPQKFIPVKPGNFAAAAFFKGLHSHPRSFRLLRESYISCFVSLFGGYCRITNC
jgi:hypothetical protein